jgi:hypothetical protein
MKSMIRNLLTAGLLAAAASITLIPALARAQNKRERSDNYWRDHWRWYDTTYGPYYRHYRRPSTLYVPPLPPDDPRITGSYGPYWGPYWAGTIGSGPVIQFGWW